MFFYSFIHLSSGTVTQLPSVTLTYTSISNNSIAISNYSIVFIMQHFTEMSFPFLITKLHVSSNFFLLIIFIIIGNLSRSIYLSIVFISNCLSMDPFIDLSNSIHIYLSIYLSHSVHICQSNFVYISLSIDTSIYRSIYLIIFMSIYLNLLLIYLSSSVHIYSSIYFILFISISLCSYLSIYLSIVTLNCQSINHHSLVLSPPSLSISI